MGKNIKSLLPVAGTVAGGFFGGPAGAAIGGALGGALAGAGKAPKVAGMDRSLFDITAEAKRAQDLTKPLLEQSQANVRAVSPLQTQALTQQGLAATGQGPSLAEAQLKQAQDRGFAQQLAAAQGQRAANPALAQRQLLLNMGNANRDLAQQAAVSRLQERDAFLNQAAAAQQGLRTDVQGDFTYATAPKQSLQQYEQQRVAAQNAANQAAAANKNALMGSIISAGGSALGNYFGSSRGNQVGTTSTTSTSSPSPSNFSQQSTFSPSGLFGSGPMTIPQKAEGGLVTKKDVPCLNKGGGIGAWFEQKKREGTFGDRAQDSQRMDDDKARAKKERHGFEPIYRDVTPSFLRKPVDKAEGGPVDGPGTETSDSIPAMLSDGEFVIKAAVVKQPHMAEILHKINAGQINSKKLKKAVEFSDVLKARNKKKD